MFAVIRHPDVEALGFCTEETLDSHRAKGWVRISEYRNEPGDFHKPDYADVYDDLDADEEPLADEPDAEAEPEPEPATDEPAPASAETTEEIES